MPLDPFYAARLALLDGVDSYESAATDPEAARRLAAWGALPDGYRSPDVVVEAAELPGPHGPVPVRVYRPLVPAGGGLLPLLVWCHGGAFVGGDLDMPEAHHTSAEIAARAPAVVVSVGYRLAVDGVHYPVPHDDVRAAFVGARRAAVGWGADPRRAALGGASAGGNLATGVAQHLRDDGEPGPSCLLLAYPALHARLPAGDDAAPGTAGLPTLLRFAPGQVAWFSDNYAGPGGGPYAFPADAGAHGLPPVTMVLSEYDDLRASGEVFARDLADTGGEVDLWVAPGAVHGHLNHGAVLPPAVETLDRFAAALRR